MSLTAILTLLLQPILAIIGSIVGMLFAMLVVSAILFSLKSIAITKSFYTKIIRMTAKYFYIASVLLDFGLIVLVECIRMYGFKHSLVEWLSLLIGILAFGMLVNVSLWSYYFSSKKISEFHSFLSEKLFDLKLWLKYKIFKRIEWKLILLKNKVKCKVRNLIGDIKWKIYDTKRKMFDDEWKYR